MSTGKTRFDWDEEKDRENQNKHNISFAMNLSQNPTFS
jgi:uncharacterized DUF497 family protein